MAVKINKDGLAHAHALILAGKVKLDDGGIVTSNEDKASLGVDGDAFSYPFIFDDKISRPALRAIRTSAAQQNEPEIFDAASGLMDKIDQTPAQLGVVKGVEVFSIGTWSGSKKVTVDGGYLDKMVQSFKDLNSSVPGFAAPIKVGHNTRVGEPAYGWVSDLRREGDKIVADFADVPGDMIDAIKKRLYNSVSIEVYPAVEYAGTVFKNVLGAVALLGAEWPAVKGLKPLSASLFAECDLEKLELGEKEEVEAMATFTQEQYDAGVTLAVNASKTEMQAALDAEAKKAKDESERADRAEAALASFQSDSLDAQIAAVIEDGIKDGRILPAQKDDMTAMASVFKDKAASKVKFGDKEVTVLDMFKSYVAGLPKAVKMGEKGSSKSQALGDDNESAEAEVDTKAKAKIVANNKLSYGEAVALVFSEEPDLKTRYAEEH